jgi:hypothetical protein
MVWFDCNEAHVDDRIVFDRILPQETFPTPVTTTTTCGLEISPWVPQMLQETKVGFVVVDVKANDGQKVIATTTRNTSDGLTNSPRIIMYHERSIAFANQC